MSAVGQGCGRDLARDTSWSLSTLNDVPEIASIHVHNNIHEDTPSIMTD